MGSCIVFCSFVCPSALSPNQNACYISNLGVAILRLMYDYIIMHILRVLVARAVHREQRDPTSYVLVPRPTLFNYSIEWLVTKNAQVWSINTQTSNFPKSLHPSADTDFLVFREIITIQAGQCGNSGKLLAMEDELLNSSKLITGLHTT